MGRRDTRVAFGVNVAAKKLAKEAYRLAAGQTSVVAKEKSSQERENKNSGKKSVGRCIRKIRAPLEAPVNYDNESRSS